MSRPRPPRQPTLSAAPSLDRPRACLLLRRSRGLCPFIFDFLIEKTSRSFDDTLPLDVQARAALRALQSFDADLYREYNELLVAYLNGTGIPGAHFVEELAADFPGADEYVTPDNVQEVIVWAVRDRLWKSRESSLLALRRGFAQASSNKGIDLSLHLKTFNTPDLMLLIQGKPEAISTVELVEHCIKWPDETSAATFEDSGGFPYGSTTVALLREVLSDEEVFTAERRQKLVSWVTSLDVLPDAGLIGHDQGKIKVKWESDEWACTGDETGWPLPRVSTCSHLLHLPNYSRREVLQDKLLRAMEERRFEEVE